MNLIIGLGKSLRHITRTHTEPRILFDDMERGPCKLNALRQRPSVGVVETAIKVILEQRRRKAGMNSRMFPVVVVGYTLLYISDVFIGQGHHAFGILAKVFGGKITRQSCLKVFATCRCTFQRHVAAHRPCLTQFVTIEIQPYILAILYRKANRIVPIIIALSGFLLQSAEIHRFHLYQRFDDRHQHCHKSRYCTDSKEPNGNAPSPTPFPLQESINS